MWITDLIKKVELRSARADSRNYSADPDLPNPQNSDSEILNSVDNLSNKFAKITEDEELNGIELKEYANRQHLNIDDVWRLIRDGKLIARTENGFVYVYGNNANYQSVASRLNSDESGSGVPQIPQEQFSKLPTLPTPSSTELETGLMRTREEIPEVRLLLEHLMLAKEQNLEILKLTQDSIQNIKQSTEKLVSSKDEIIALKDEKLSATQLQIDDLQTKLREQEDEKTRLRQDIEDLQMLNNALVQDTLP